MKNRTTPTGGGDSFVAQFVINFWSEETRASGGGNLARRSKVHDDVQSRVKWVELGASFCKPYTKLLLTGKSI